MKNHYDILGIQENATLDEIKKAYRKLSMKFHPDKNENDEYFSDMFKRITEAYDTLSDSGKRKNYDNSINSHSSKENTQVDPLFFDAAMLFVAHQVASSAMLQQKFSIGFNRAGNIMEQLENAGIIGPFNGSFREVKLSKDDIESRYNLRVKEEVNPTKIFKNNSTTHHSVWYKVRSWKRVKRVILFIDLVLLIVLFRDPILQEINSISSAGIETNSYNGRVISVNGLRLRVEPNDNATILLTIPSNAKLNIIKTDGPTQIIEGKSANWYQVKYEHHIGWVWGGFVSKIN